MSIIQELHALSGEPQSQAEYAIRLLNQRKRPDVVLAALSILRETPTQEARQQLLNLYSHYATNGLKRDPGAHMRRTILDALRPIALPEDAALLLAAVTTYEFLPPYFNEDAAVLRSGALLILNELQEPVAGYHAARLLVDGHTQEMSGEPALTAIRVLESQDQLLPLYQIVMSNPTPVLPDVLSECLRCLTRIPEHLLPDVIARHGQSKHGVILVGLYDLLICHRNGPQHLGFLAASLISQQDHDIYRYLVIALLSARQPVLISLLANTIPLGTDSQRMAIVREATTIFQADPDIAELASKLLASS